MKQRALGSQGLETSAQGLGCMGMSEFYGPRDETEAIATIRRARDLGVTFLDTADMYGRGANEELVGRAIAGDRDSWVVATKFGIQRGETGFIAGICGKPDYVKSACEASLRRLGIDTIDLYYQHRVDPSVPIEDTVGAMKDLVDEGKVRTIGLSEAGAQTIRKAHAVHPITAIQSEWSLWSRDIESDVVPTARELGIGIVAYSPVGRGFLTGRIRSVDDLAEDDNRRNMPRFQGENFEKNLELVRVIEQLSENRSLTPAQLALAWVHSRGNDVFPIPGTKRRSYLEENAAAFDVELSEDELEEIESAVPADLVSGLRYPEVMMPFINA